MRSYNWGGTSSARYDDSIYFTWDELGVNQDATSPSIPDETYDDFEDGLGCWDTRGNVEIAEQGVVTGHSMRLDDATRSHAVWDCAGTYNTHERVEFRGVYRINSSRFQHRFRLEGINSDSLNLLINTSRGSIYFATSVLDSPGSETIEHAFTNTWARFRLELDGEGSVRAKVWEYDEKEPVDWEISRKVDNFDFKFRAGVGGNNHDREMLVDEVEIVPGGADDQATIEGSVTDSTGQTLEDIEVRAQNQETDEVIVTDTDANGAFEMEVEPEREYRVLIFDQFGLEQTEFEKFVELDEEETRELGIELLSKFEIFEAQKLGSDEIAGLAPRIDDLSTPLIAEENTVESEIQAIEAAMNNEDIDRELAEESLERMVLGEAMVNRTLEAVTDSTPINLAGYDWSQGPLIFEDEMPDFDLLFQTSKGIVIGILESFYSIKKIAKEAAGDLADKVIDAIVSGIGNFIRDLLSDFQTVLDTADRALTIGEMLVDIEDAADEALDRLEDGATFDNVRSVVEDLADPIADQIANSILAAIELLSIEEQLDDLNTALSANSVTQDPQFANDIVTLADDTRTELRDIETQVEQAEAQMNPESDALEELINLAGELADAGFSDILGLLASILTIVEDLVDVISSGFNIGFGIVRTRQIYTDSAAVVNDITETV